MIRTSALRNALFIAVLSCAVSAAPSDPLPPGAVCRLGPVRHFASAQTGFVAFSADGKRLFAAAGEHTTHVWDWPVVKPPRTLSRPGERVTTRAVPSADGKTLAYGTTDSAVLLADAATGAVRRSVAIPRGAVQEVAFAADGTRFAAFDTNAILHLWGDGDKPVWEAKFAEAQPLCSGVRRRPCTCRL